MNVATYASFLPAAVLGHLAVLGAPPRTALVERQAAALLLIDITGFTRLTAAAERDGPAGTERLSRSLNAYLGRIIDIVHGHGGDVAKIIGDAVVPIWSAPDGDIAAAARQAAACGLAIADELGESDGGSEHRLALKVGLCAGPTEAIHVGGLDGHWLFTLAGAAVAQLTGLERRMETGAVIASPEAWALLADRYVGQPIDEGFVRVSPRSTTAPAAGGIPERATPPLDAIRAYVPAAALARLEAGQADWLAELRRTTVVFVAVRGLGRSPGSPADVEELERVTLAAQRTLVRYDGWLKEITLDDKGTTLVAAFGVPPFSHQDDPARAIAAALAIQSDLADLGLESGAGVATGSAFCGPVGNGGRRDFVVLGQHVNLAARLMQAAADGQVLCDGATRDAAAAARTFERLPAYVLKGMSSPIDVYRVGTGPLADTVSTAIVDRREERGIAARSLERLRSGQGGLLTLEGEPGIGKSRLVAEWLRGARDAGIEAIVGAAAEIEAATPYHAWRQVYEHLFGITAVADRSARRRLVLDALPVEQRELAPLLDPILALDLPDNDVTAQLAGEVRADNTRDVLVAALASAAERGPLLVVLEDAHWLDSASRSLLARAQREIPALLLLVTMRPTADAATDPITAVREAATTVRLDRLSREDAIALACERTGATRLAEPVAAVLAQRAEGNPLYIEQLTYAMRDSGRIVVENGLVRAVGGERLAESITPESVQHIITTRLDQLPPAEALTLKVASVIGQRFGLRTLHDIYPLQIEPGTLLDHLRTLTRLDLVAPTPLAPETAYEFRHVITQEVAYNLMLAAQSEGLHRRLAEWYEQTYAADLSPFHAFLAHHWRKAGVAAKAINHLEQAGIQALETFANEEATGFLGQAVALAAEAGVPVDRKREARWRLGLGEAAVHMSQYRAGREHLEAGLQLLGAPAPHSTRQQTTSLLRELARQVVRRLRLARGARSLSDEQREELVLSFRAYERLAEASYYGRETLLPLYCVIRILNEAEASGIPAEIARGYAGTGALFGVVPLPRVAQWYLDRATARLDDVDDLTTHEIVNIVVGFYHVGAGHWDDARERLRLVRRLARRLGDRRRLDDALANLMEIAYLRGAFASTAEYADELRRSARARNDHRFEGEGLVGLAYAAWQMDDRVEADRSLAALRAILAAEPDLIDELKIKAAGLQAVVELGRDGQAAQVAADEAMRLTAGQRPTYFGTFMGYVGPAEVYLHLLESGDAPREGRARATEALKRVAGFAAVFPVGRPRAETLAGRHSWLAGRHEVAFRSWRRAVGLAEELDMPYEAALARYEIARHLEPKDAARAEHLERARTALAELGSTRLLSEIEAALASTTERP